MSRYDVAPDDEPLDLSAVAADDRVVEILQRSLSPNAAVVWDDDDEVDDPAFALLRTLQRDVSDDLPQILPAEITPLLGRRRLGRGVTIAAITAGVLSIGGVAAASSAGQPLAGVRSAVASAVTSVVQAITPDDPAPKTAARPAELPAPAGDAVNTAARSAAAVLQIRANLDRAAVLLDRGRYDAAEQQLEAVVRKLPLVTDEAMHADLADELATLQEQLTARADDGSTDQSGRGDAGTDGRDASTDRSADGQGAERSNTPPEPTDRSGRSTDTGRDSGDGAPAVEPPHSQDSAATGSGSSD